MYQNHIIMVLLIEDPLCLTLEWPNENTSLETYPVHKPNMGIFLCKIWLMFYWIYNSHLPDNFRHEMMTKNSKIEGHSSMPSLLKWKNMEHEIRTYSNPLLECGDSIEGVVYCGVVVIFFGWRRQKEFPPFNNFFFMPRCWLLLLRKSYEWWSFWVPASNKIENSGENFLLVFFYNNIEMKGYNIINGAKVV